MQVRKIDDLNLYGSHPLSQDAEGNFICTMADIFPTYRSIIVGTGLHVNLALEFMEILAESRGRELAESEKEKIYEDMVAVTRQGKQLVIRSSPNDMEQVFRAAEQLERVVPAEMIRFTGRGDPMVREAFKLRGECWKMAPRYFTIEAIIGQIRLSRVSVGTRNQYYYMIEAGGRLLTYQEFASVGESLPDLKSFRRRIHEIVDLHQRFNARLVRELDFFMVDKKKFNFSLIQKLDEYLQDCEQWEELEQKRARELFNRALDNFKNTLEPGFWRDDPHNPLWRTYMYSQLNDIPPTEESILGVSYEFNMNINWLPGCRIKDSKAIMDANAQDVVRDIINEFFRFYGPMEYINFGRVMRSQSQKRAAGAYREVYIVMLKQKGSPVEQIRIMRKFRRNTLYYLNRGYPLETAQRLAEGYMQYTMDRRELVSMLGVVTPPLHSLARKEILPGIGEVSADYIDRPYVEGLATDKIPFYYFESEPFLTAFAALMGDAAAPNLIVGRSDPNSGAVFFGDGDEMLQFEDDDKVPTGIVLADFTGAFADVVSPLDKFAPYYVEYLVRLLGRIHIKSFTRQQLIEIANLFIDSLAQRIDRTKELLRPGGALESEIKEMLSDREVETNPILVKWEKTLERLHGLKVEDFIEHFRSEVYQRMHYTV